MTYTRNMTALQRNNKRRSNARLAARVAAFASDAMAFAALLALGGAIYLGAVALGGDEYGACPTEDSANCYWDSKAQGNGVGRSFINVNGEVRYIGQ